MEWQGDMSVGGMAGWCVGWVVCQLVKWKGGVLAGHWWNGWVGGWNGWIVCWLVKWQSDGLVGGMAG